MFQKYPRQPTAEDYTNLTLVYGRQGLDFDSAHEKSTAFLARFDVYKNVELPADTVFNTWVGKPKRIAPVGLDRFNPSGMARMPYVCVPVARVPSWISRELHTLILITHHGSYNGFELWNDAARDELYDVVTTNTVLDVFENIKGLAHAWFKAARNSPESVFKLYRDFDFGTSHRDSMFSALIDCQNQPNYSEPNNAT